MSSPAADLHQFASIGRLLAGIVHEINTPIGSIFSNTEVILRSLEMLEPLLADGRPESIEKARRILATCQSLAAVDRIACERIRSVIRGLKTLLAGRRRRTAQSGSERAFARHAEADPGGVPQARRGGDGFRRAARRWSAIRKC